MGDKYMNIEIDSYVKCFAKGESFWGSITYHDEEYAYVFIDNHVFKQTFHYGDVILIPMQRIKTFYLHEMTNKWIYQTKI